MYNPALAHQALRIDAQNGVLLPLRVVIRQVGDSVVVEAGDPRTPVEVMGGAGLVGVAQDTARRLAQASADVAVMAAAGRSRGGRARVAENRDVRANGYPEV